MSESDLVFSPPSEEVHEETRQQLPLVNNHGFGAEISQLSELVDTRDLKILNKYGNQEGLKTILKTNESGISKHDPKDHSDRKSAYVSIIS